jgi:hypothetical protein
MPSAVYTLGDIATRLSLLEVACNRCERRGRLRISRLLTKYSAEMPVPALLRSIAADCPRMHAERISEICGVYCPQLSGLFGRPGR